MANPKERPILFSGPMVRAILKGRKTQTRRLVKEPLQFLGGRGEEGDPAQWGWAFDGPEHHGWMVLAPGFNERHDHGRVSIPCPYGVVGDRLWVRETWAPHADEEETFRNYHAGQRGDAGLFEPGAVRPEIFYRADGGDPHVNAWRPSIHMPRWVSRFTLEVVSVRVERLQDISEEDARAEGFSPGTEELLGGAVTSMSAADYFRTTWWDLYGFESWDANPWVWVVEFRREKKEV